MGWEGEHGVGGRAWDGRKSTGWEGEHGMGGRAWGIIGHIANGIMAGRQAHPLEVLDKLGSRRLEGQHGMGRRAWDGRESMGWEGEHGVGGRAWDGRESM